MIPYVDPYAGVEPEVGDELAEMAGEDRTISDSESKPEIWAEPEEIPKLLPEVPTMPEELLPEAIKSFAMDISERLQVPLEIPATAIVTALAAVVGRSHRIYPKRYDSWEVTPNLWGMIIGRSGLMKSPAIEAALRPLGGLAKIARKEFDEGLQVHKVDQEIHKAKIDAARDTLKKAMKNDGADDIGRIRQELIDLERSGEGLRPSERRYRINDATCEKLIELLAENPRGLLVYRDELSGWLRGLDKQGRETDRSFFLESWNGYGSFTTDRIGRGTVHVDAVCVSLLGGIQPGKLHSYVSDALDCKAGDDGLLQRFQLAVYPESPKTWRNIDRRPDFDAQDRVARVFGILDRIQDGPVLHFSDEGQELFDAWLTKLQNRLFSGEVGSPALESHLAKYRKLMPALALLFHLAGWADAQIETAPGTIDPVTVDSAALAAAWCDYFEMHAKKVYSGTLNPDLQAAHELAKRIQDGKVSHLCKVREIYRNEWAGLKTKEAVYGAVAVLADCGWLRLTTIKGEEGRPSDRIELHPRFRGDA